MSKRIKELFLGAEMMVIPVSKIILEKNCPKIYLSSCEKAPCLVDTCLISDGEGILSWGFCEGLHE